MDEVTLPKAAFEALKQQISTLQATVDRLNAIIEEKNQIILNQNRVVPFSSAFNQDSHRQIFSSVISVHSLSKSSYHI